MKLIFAGGGTLGSVTPLLAVIEKIKEKNPKADILWLGTKNGPEKKIVEEAGIKFRPIFSGKFRRYLSLRNILDFFWIKVAVWQSLFIIIKEKPDWVISAGGFVAVPVVFASWFWRVPVLIHQQDTRAGLANKICAPFAKKITVVFEKSLKDFSESKTFLVGNPVRGEILQGSRERGIKNFRLGNNLPVLLVLGGGTGSEFLNKLVKDNLSGLLDFCEIIHLTGGKGGVEQVAGYHPFEFLTKEMADVYAVADLVVSRAGMGVLTEFSALKKPSILIPLAGHQEKNAGIFDKKDAAMVLNEKNLVPEEFIKKVKNLIKDRTALKKMGKNAGETIDTRNAAERIIELIK